MKNTFDKRVRPRVFKEGDLVLKKRLPNVKDPHGKWAPNYEGLYVVKQAFSRGALVLGDSKGQELTHPINVDAERIRRINLQVFRMEELVPTNAKESMHKAKPKVENLATTGETPEAQPQIGIALA
ncbi:hypothetical protein CR513_24637, partial [Mucuna pruriens]